MPEVNFLPINKTVSADKGETILDVALNHDIPLQHACGGFCACTTCHVIVKEGLENLSPMEEEESERIQGIDRFCKESRLGCQTKVLGDTKVEIVNLDEL